MKELDPKDKTTKQESEKPPEDEKAKIIHKDGTSEAALTESNYLEEAW